MEFFRYVNVLRKHLRWIVLLTVIGGGAACGFSLRQHKVYKATATLLVNVASPTSLIPYLATSLSNNNGTPPLEQLANTYSVFLQSRSFDGQIVKALGLKTTPDEFAKHVSSALVPDTNYFTIGVTWGDPRQAAAIANSIARTFVQENTAAQAATGGNDAATQISQSLAYFRRKIQTLQRSYDQLTSNARANQARVDAVSNDLNTAEDTYYRLLGTAGATASGAATNAATLSDPATAPTIPISPKVTLNTLAGIVAGLVLGLLLAFVLDYLDYSLRTPEDMEALVGQTPLGIVATFGPAQGARRGLPFSRKGGHSATTKKTAAARAGNGASNGNGNGHGAATHPFDPALATLSVVNPKLITIAQPRASVSEAFRTLRTSLEFSSLDKPLKSLVVTSSLPSEGKSTVSANLAVAIAQTGKRVILVDADLRRPTVHKLFDVKPATGLTTILLNRENRERAIADALQPTMVPTLQVIASGPQPPNPAELLSSESMIALVRDLEGKADLVIFDTPPMGPLTDAVVLSTRVSGTLLVARAGSTRRTVISNSLAMLQKVGGNVVGTVLNMVDLKGISNYSYYSYYSNGYYGREEAVAASGGRAKN